MRYSIRVIATVIGCLLSCVAAAQDQCPASARSVTVFFINGVWNERSEAARSASDLEARVRQYLADMGELAPLIPACLFVESAYNYSDGVNADLNETASLIDEEEFIQLLRRRRDAPETSASQKAQYEEAIRVLIQSRYDAFPDLKRMVNDHFLPLAISGNRPIIVGHSEGNLFANMAYRTLALVAGSSARPRLVAVASPSSFVEGSDVHTTAFEDDVILSYSRLLDTDAPVLPLAGNSGNTPDRLCHAVSDRYIQDVPLACHLFAYYIDGEATGRAIAAQVVEAVVSGSNPPNQSPNAGFAISLLGRSPMTSSPPAAVIQTLAVPAMPSCGSCAIFDFDGAAPYSSDPDGAVSIWRWLIDGTLGPSSSSFSRSLSVGTHTVSLMVTDNQGATSAVAQAVVVVTPVAVLPPVAVGDGPFVISQGASFALQPPGVLVNDTYPAGATVEFLEPLPQAVLAANPDGSFTLDLSSIPTFSGVVALNYVIHSVNGDSNIGTVRINVRQSQQPSWTQKLPVNSPSSRYLAGLTYDAYRGETVLFGGRDSTNRNDTWVWNGVNWTLKNPTHSPSPRQVLAMTYDEARHEVVLFGGYDNGFLNPYLNDTWVWDGSDWTQRSPSNRPSGRSGAMVYDVMRGEVLLFGGNDGSRLLNDTWTWDGSNWSQRAPLSMPTPRYRHDMSYDAARGLVVLFGGNDNNGIGSRDDTWTWDGATWTEANALSRPPALTGHRMAYDAALGRVVLFGGAAETWLWDGMNWADVSSAVSPSARDLFSLSYDEVRQQIVLFGGTVSLPGALGDTWVLSTDNVAPVSGFAMNVGSVSSLSSPPASSLQSLAVTTDQSCGRCARVTFDGSAPLSADRDGTVVAWQWLIDGSAGPTSQTFSRPLSIGTHTISLIVTDNQGATSAVAQAVIVVTSSAVLPPVAVGDGPFVISQGASFALQPPGVLANDTYPAGATAEFLDPLPQSILAANPDGSLSIDMSRDPTFVGSFSIGYVIHSSAGDSNSASVQFSVTPVAVDTDGDGIPDVSDACPTVAGPCGYRIQDLGGLAGSTTQTYVNGVSGNGTAVGCATVGTSSRAFVWTRSVGIRDIGTLGGASACATAVNSNGVVAGYSNAADGTLHGFVWTTATGMEDLGFMAFPVSINNADAVAGTLRYPSGSQLFVWTRAAGLTALGQPVGMRHAEAVKMNNGGSIALNAIPLDASQPRRAYLWRPGGLWIELGSLGGSYTEVNDMNDSDVVVGTAETAAGVPHVYSWSPVAGLLDLAPGVGRALNAAGDIVGGLGDGNSSSAFLWTATAGVQNLGTLGGDFSIADRISDSGVVAGISNVIGNGFQHGFAWSRLGGVKDLGTLGGSFSLSAGFAADGTLIGTSYRTRNVDAHLAAWSLASGFDFNTSSSQVLCSGPQSGGFQGYQYLGLGLSGQLSTASIRMQTPPPTFYGKTAALEIRESDSPLLTWTDVMAQSRVVWASGTTVASRTFVSGYDGVVAFDQPEVGVGYAFDPTRHYYFVPMFFTNDGGGSCQPSYLYGSTNPDSYAGGGAVGVPGVQDLSFSLEGISVVR